MKTEYPLLPELARLAFLPFASNYLCEKSFSTITYIKIKYRSNLKDLEPVLRPTIIEIKPRFDLLCENMQAHQSHQKYCQFYCFLFNMFYIIKFYYILVPRGREKIWLSKVGRYEKSLKCTGLIYDRRSCFDLNKLFHHKKKTKTIDISSFSFSTVG